MTQSDEVGSLRRLPPREVFKHEAYDFTAWLEKNVDRLSGAIGLDLESAEREKSAGDFSADLLAEDGDGRRAIIENQLEKTDHKHLGQVLTYLTVLDAEIAVWVTADARPEHVSAVSWLNENAGGADFYLVKVEGVQVDDSRPAPLFTQIIGPSAETRAAEQTKKEWDDRDRSRYQFFNELLDLTKQRTRRFDNVSPRRGRSVEASAGRGFEFRYTVLGDESRAMLRIDFGDTQVVNDEAFKALQQHRDKIETKVGSDFEWVQDESRRRLLLIRIPIGYENEDQWGQAFEELAESMAKLEEAVEPYLDEARTAADRRADQSDSPADIGPSDNTG